jgi:hypothetical protein
MRISKEVLVRQVVYRVTRIFIPTLIAIGTIIFCLNYFVYKPDVYVPTLSEIFDISLVFTLLFLRVKISKLYWKSILSELFLIGITSGLIYILWHSIIGWRYTGFCQNIKIEDILFIKTIYIAYIYIFDFFKKKLH